jgi:pilus assembly protein CpaC
LNTTIKWLITANDAKVLSAPNLVVSLGATASIVTGQDIPIQTIQVVSGSTTTSTKFKRVGVTLNVTPNIINDNSVNLTVNPQVSNVQRYENIQQNEGTYPVPVISIRNIQTELTLKDGQIVMLGGLYSHTEKDNEDRVPFLSDLPFVGELFTGKNQSKELTQLIFFLKINILSPREIADGIIYDPGKQAQTIRKVGDIIKNSKQIFPHKDELEVEKFKKELMDGRGSKKFMKAIDGKD